MADEDAKLDALRQMLIKGEANGPAHYNFNPLMAQLDRDHDWAEC